MTKLTNGPATTTSKTTMTSVSRDLVAIIKACHDASVSEITMGDIHIIFNGAKSPEYLTDVAKSPNNGSRSVPSEPVTSQEDELERLILSDPSAYEEVVEVTE